MELADAMSLVLSEGLSFDGMVIQARGGQDPGRQRVRDVIAAMQSICDALQGEPHIDRQLANAAYALAVHLPASIEQWNKSCVWTDDFIELMEQIERLFDGTY